MRTVYDTDVDPINERRCAFGRKLAMSLFHVHGNRHWIIIQVKYNLVKFIKQYNMKLVITIYNICNKYTFVAIKYGLQVSI